MDRAPTSSTRLAFGRFLVLPHRRELLADGQLVRLGGRAFDVLMVLIEAHGAVVSKDALMARVWPDRVVEENALEAQISALRAAFGVDRKLMRTVSGRGYQFTGEIRILPASEDDRLAGSKAAPEPLSILPATNLPERVSEFIGRDDEVREILSLVALHRLVTLTGPGGIGKTRLALTVARELLPEFTDGVWSAEFSPLADPGLVPATVAAAVGLEPAAGELSARRVAQALAGRRLMLVLDTCEHVIDAAAELAEAVLQAGSGVHVVATSREPLRAEGEQVYPVPPLAVPIGEGDDPWQYGAVQLFAARSRGSGAHVRHDQRGASAIAAICRQLDGIPLAIELAAARAATLGITELGEHLNDSFNLLTGGRRTALARHQTLRATLDWSFELLPEAERVILRRLAVFAGAFRLDAAGAVAASADIAPPDVVDGLANLVEKSLVATVGDGTIRLYRLLDTTRAYAIEKLVESGEINAIRRRHAEYYRDLLQAAAEEKAATDNWPAAYATEIDNIRAALAWAFASEGDTSIGVALAAASAQLWLELSLLSECHGWMAKALDFLRVEDRGTRQEMVLQSAFGYSLMFTKSLSDAAHAALRRACELAEHFQDFDYQLRTLAGLAACCHRLEDFEGARVIGRRAEAVASQASDPVSLSIADWVLGTSLLFLGEYGEALTYTLRTRRLTQAPSVRRAHMVRLGRDGFISAGCTTAHIQWTQGLFEQSAQTAQDVLVVAQGGDHPLSLCTALVWCGCAIPLWLGDLETAGQSVSRLKAHAEKYDLNAFYAYGIGFDGQFSAQRGELAAAERSLRSCQQMLRLRHSDNYPPFLSTLAEVLAKAGRAEESLAAVEEVLLRVGQNHQLWWMPEALRIKGEVLLSCKGDTTSAEDHFHQSLDLARRQGALSWELRTATSLASLLRDQVRPADAEALLQSVYNRFTEGFDTADLKTARTLLGAVCNAPPRPAPT